MELPMRNKAPDHGIRIPFEDLAQFVADVFVRAGMYPHDARLMGETLASADQRCVYSHGTMQTPGYVRKILAGDINPCPTVTVISETDTTLVLDGDGGLGYFPSFRGTEVAIAKAKQHGVGVATTRNHHHFGAAGHYSRMALPHNCIGLAVSAHRYGLDPAHSLMNASGGSPMSIAFPTRTQPPLVLDMGATFLPTETELMEKYHSVFMKSLGLGVAFQALGGILAGIWISELERPVSKWESNQGAFIAVFSVRHLMSVDQFELSLDNFIRQARQMKPFPGMSQTELPGGMEWRWEREHEMIGIPIAETHQEALQEIADETGVIAPFDLFEHTRF
ncbi:MAG: Ldh family oxidoreductase [candidate division Zixibacteria bacterium]|nr:Ldh family oxidoreductase [candidate division Zixibacteria bacterium]